MTGQDQAKIAVTCDVPVIDAHHHLFDEKFVEYMQASRFLIHEYLAGLGGDHGVIATVAVNSAAMYRRSGPEAMAPVGETEFLNGQAAMAASGLYGDCAVAAGIISFADLRLGAAVRDVLEAHIAAAPARFRGVRQTAMWDSDASIVGERYGMGQHGYARKDFRAGFAELAPLGLTFDAFVMAPQLEDVRDLARAFPETTIVLNHLGQPVNVGVHAGRLAEEYPQWKRDMLEIAACPNVSVKMGGLGTFLGGSPSYRARPAVGPRALAEEWRPYAEATVEMFGADRCMFESNLPTDGAGSFLDIRDAYLLITAGCSREERRMIFAGTARRVYRLEIPAH